MTNLLASATIIPQTVDFEKVKDGWNMELMIFRAGLDSVVLINVNLSTANAAERFSHCQRTFDIWWMWRRLRE